MADLEYSGRTPQTVSFQIGSFDRFHVYLATGQLAIEDASDPTIIAFVPLSARSVFTISDDMFTTTFFAFSCFCYHTVHFTINYSFTLSMNP